MTLATPAPATSSGAPNLAPAAPVANGTTTTSDTEPPARALSGGAELGPSGVHFRVFAPARKSIEVVIESAAASGPIALSPEDASSGEAGYWSTLVLGLAPGARYRFRVDGDDNLLPDPFSRFQPEGPHGPSEVVDPSAFRWSDENWKGVSLTGQIIYEMHIGTFSSAGTWTGAAEKLGQLRELGVTVLQVMPVAEFPGSFGWGYDGVDFFAPFHGYGSPDDFRRFVDEAHRLGIAVILDVVYNHFGPDGNYLSRYAAEYFADKDTEWGRAINYDGKDPRGARRLVVDNAAYWIREYHLDGLRLDATQAIFDASEEHVVAALTAAARAAAGQRQVIVVAENEGQDTRLVRPRDRGGLGLDAVYNEDFHHSAVVAATGRREGYYSEYRGSAQELLSAVKHGFLFQGQLYHWQKQRRGKPLRGSPRRAAAAFLENHDQLANSSTGTRLWRDTGRGRHRALTTLLLLGPWTPLLFQGSEWNATSPFHYFADHNPDLRTLVRKGRAQFLAQFPSAASLEAQAALPDPGERKVFEACRLPWPERNLPEHAAALALHRDLIALRKADKTIATQGEGGVVIDGAVLGAEAFLVRYLTDDPANDRMLLVNLGPELALTPAPEPLLAPPEGMRWQLAFSSEERAYGGPGSVAPETPAGGFTIAGHAASLLRPTSVIAHDER